MDIINFYNNFFTFSEPEVTTKQFSDNDKNNTLSLVSGLRGYLGSALKNGKMKRGVEVILLQDGGIKYLPTLG